MSKTNDMQSVQDEDLKSYLAEMRKGATEAAGRYKKEASDIAQNAPIVKGVTDSYYSGSSDPAMEGLGQTLYNLSPFAVRKAYQMGAKAINRETTQAQRNKEYLADLWDEEINKQNVERMIAEREQKILKSMPTLGQTKEGLEAVKDRARREVYSGFLLAHKFGAPTAPPLAPADEYRRSLMEREFKTSGSKASGSFYDSGKLPKLPKKAQALVRLMGMTAAAAGVLRGTGEATKQEPVGRQGVWPGTTPTY